jgi:hypothetical protein
LTFVLPWKPPLTISLIMVFHLPLALQGAGIAAGACG